jgi:hypothetical protein
MLSPVEQEYLAQARQMQALSSTRMHLLCGVPVVLARLTALSAERRRS